LPGPLLVVMLLVLLMLVLLVLVLLVLVLVLVLLAAGTAACIARSLAKTTGVPPAISTSS
jgi:hypothetical protein